MKFPISHTLLMSRRRHSWERCGCAVLTATPLERPVALPVASPFRDLPRNSVRRALEGLRISGPPDPPITPLSSEPTADHEVAVPPLVRAHNPKVASSKSRPRYGMKAPQIQDFCFGCLTDNRVQNWAWGKVGSGRSLPGPFMKPRPT